MHYRLIVLLTNAIEMRSNLCFVICTTIRGKTFNLSPLNPEILNETLDSKAASHIEDMGFVLFWIFALCFETILDTIAIICIHFTNVIW